MEDSLPLKEKVELVNESRDRINESSHLIIKLWEQVHLENNEGGRDAVLQIRLEIQNIINEMNKIGSFCDDSARKIIRLFSHYGGTFTIYDSPKEFFLQGAIIKYWASMANAIPLNFNKSPFTISAGIEFDLSKIKARLEGIYKRK
jgi:hypothetical protein